ncbi:MAG: DUF4037 domain-containing protein [Chitinophagales bacterium]
MQNNNELLKNLAHQEAKRLLVEDSAIQSISIVGSVAYELTDQYSDIDLLILYNDISDEQYELWRKDAEYLNPVYVIGGKEHDFMTVGRYVEGIKIDFGRIKADKFQQSVDAVIKNNDIELSHQAVLFGINNSEVFYDKGIVADWRKQIEVYPEALIFKTLQTSLTFTPKSVYEGMGVYRNDSLFIYECLVEDLKKMLQTIFCLNRVYHPGKAKGLNWIIEQQLPIQPTDFLQRMQSLLNSKEAEGVAEMLRLIAEVYELVGRERPDFDLTAFWKRFEVKLRE